MFMAVLQIKCPWCLLQGRQGQRGTTLLRGVKTPLLSIPYREIRAALISHGGSRVVPVLPRIRGRLVSFIAMRSICSPPKCARGTCKEGREGKYGKSLDRWFGFDMIFPAQRCAPGNPPNPGVFSFYICKYMNIIFIIKKENYELDLLRKQIVLIL